MRLLPALSFVIAAGLAGAAFAAPPKLVDSRPAEGALATRPATMHFTLDQAVDPQTASYEVLMMTMPGMTMKEPMVMSVVGSAFDPATKILTAELKSPLPAGGYKVNWRVKNAAGEEGRGELNFDVR